MSSNPNQSAGTDKWEAASIGRRPETPAQRPEISRARPYQISLLSGFSQLIHGFSHREMGSVHPREAGGLPNLAEALGISAEAIVSTRQVHSSRVVQVPGPEFNCLGGRQGVDGLVTDMPGLFLLGYFADCVPVIAYDPIRGAVGLAHAGWRGTLLGIAERLVEKLVQSFGTRPPDVVAGIGPAIGPCCYEVGSDVVEAVRARLPGGEALLRPGRPGHAYLDLWEANRQALLRAGLDSGHIEVTGLCTSCQVERFFSFRREGRLNGLFGAVIGVKDRERGSYG